jgi:hypothetical protein
MPLIRVKPVTPEDRAMIALANQHLRLSTGKEMGVALAAAAIALQGAIETARLAVDPVPLPDYMDRLMEDCGRLVRDVRGSYVCE